MKNKGKLLFLILLACGVIYLLMVKLPCSRLECLLIKDGNQYKIKTVYEENNYVFRALYTKENSFLKAEMRTNSTLEEANSAVQTQIARTKGLFEEASAPYPGELSNIISCGNEYKPVYSSRQQNGIQVSYFEGYVNDRLVFGSCVDDQAAYHDTLTMFYCPKQKKFYQVEIIIPRKEFLKYPEENESILASLGCKN
ncbi:MAG: hypothetical protein Q7S39_07310 [Ignavibacteria bacterium]|nr:hypothetical protein [Ignavibacteria bacterium]